MENEVGWASTLSESAGMKDSDRTTWGAMVSAPHFLRGFHLITIETWNEKLHTHSS